MKKSLEEKKREMKERMGEEIDRYFKELEEGIKDPECDINGFEKIMKNNQERNKAIVNEVTGETLSGIEATVNKKMRAMRGSIAETEK
jgi:predicted phage tail protein